MWWHKPLDVGEPEKLSLDASLTGDELLNGAKLLAAMCVKSKLDNAVSEFTHLHKEMKGFVFNVEYKYLEETAAFGSTIDKDIPARPIDVAAGFGATVDRESGIWAYPVDVEQLDTTPKQKPYLLHSLVYPPLMEKYALKKNKRRSDVWGNVLLCDIDSKWREVEGRGKKKIGTSDLIPTRLKFHWCLGPPLTSATPT
ncbi:hypothetical protein N0V85_002701 [Neurospora sp. IMI 360204]|nr:hypothetical protein N0V85_002701 [Neurospora sp. IMI 360204]